jgi:putative endonuclease
MSRQLTGRAGEDLAASAALAEGYEIVTRNYRCPLGEIDLILQRGDVVVFAEVKTRTGTSFGDAWESVTPSKQNRLKKIALWYTREAGITDRSFRFDVFSISNRKDRWDYRWFKDAF